MSSKRTPDPSRVEAFRFHSTWGSSILGENAKGALDLARAEELLRARVADGTARVLWDYESDPYEAPHGMTDEQVSDKFESGAWEGPFWVCLQVEGETVAGLGGVVLDGHGARPGRIYGTSLGSDELGDGWSPDPYARSMEAELALEAVDELAAPISGRRGLASLLGNLVAA